jgi:HipA-like C-terminal domain
MDNLHNQLKGVLQGGAKKPADLLHKLNINQSKFSRLISASDGVISIGKARSTVYASTRNFRGMGSKFPIFRVTSKGAVQAYGELSVLVAGQFAIEIDQHKSRQLFDGLPYFLQDMRPQGFIGRSFTNKNRDLRLPDRIADWSDDDALYALVCRGEDCIGEIIVGNESLERFYQSLASPVMPIRANERETRYVKLAEEAMACTTAGSSVGGEQPKFTTSIIPINHGETERVIVKFSPADNTPVSTRWRDLLIAKHIALESIRKTEYAAAKSDVLLAGNRVFLEVTHFDRHGAHGRSGVISIGAIDDEYFGMRDTWIKAVTRLFDQKMISSTDAKALRYQAVFGQLIGNTDQHFGNASLINTRNGTVPYRLAPAYDVLPMLYAPVNGEIVPRKLSPPMPTSETLDVWMPAMKNASAYWTQLVSDIRLSDDFRDIAFENIKELDKLSPIARNIAKA